MTLYTDLESKSDIDLIRRAGDDHKRYANDCRAALKYADGDQLEDTRTELYRRFPRSQVGRAGQEIMPVVVPVAQRFVDEQATAYNRAVTRTLAGEDGAEVPDATKQLARALGDACYDETMHELDRMVVNVRAAGHEPHEKHGKLGVNLVPPCDAYPIADPAPGFRPAQQDDYLGYVVEKASHAPGKRLFCLHRPGRLVYFEGPAPNAPEKVTGRYAVPYAPGQMLTWWHKRMPTMRLLPDAPSSLLLGNRELNVMFSVLFDTIRFQGYAIPVLGLVNPSDPKAKRAHGLRFPLVLQAGAETADMLQAASTFTEQIEVLRSFVGFLAMTERLSPNDITLDGRGASPASGFAKFVDSLPKLDAREERLRRLTAMEEQYAWPRLAAVLVNTGKLDEKYAGLRMRVRFEGIRYPETEAERKQRIETDLEHGFTTRARLLAERNRVSLDDARTELEANRADNAAQAPPQPKTQGAPGGGMFGQLIGRRESAKAATPQGKEVN